MTYRRTTRTTFAIALGLAVVAGACSDKQDVGKGVNTDLKSKLNELSTTTTVDPNATTTTVKVNAINTTATTAPKVVATTATTVKQTTTTIDTAFPVGINSDNSGKNQFDPNAIGPIRINGLVRFTNNDTKVRSVVSVDGGFRSPDLQPGQSWVYKATKSSASSNGGVFHLVDGTRQLRHRDAAGRLMRGTLVRVGALLLLAASLAGCGNGKVEGTLGNKVKQLESPAPPPDMLGLTPQSEDVSKLISTVSDLYVNAVSIYSLRKDDVVQATLQISRFNSKARPNDPDFRKALVTNLGGSEGTPTTVGKDTVFITQGTRQRVAVWFRSKNVFILTTRDDYDMPRALLRESLQIGEVAK